MKKYYLLTTLTVLIGTSTFAQDIHNVYKDALALSKNVKNGTTLDTTTKSWWIALLKGYIADTNAANKLKTYDAFVQYFNGNPYLNFLLHPSEKSLLVKAGAEPRFAVYDNISLTGISPISAQTTDNNFSAPAIASALANVVIERAKQELTVTFFDRFKADLLKYPYLDTLFPKTTAFIMNIESYLYAGSLNTLRQAFAADLSNLPAQIPAAINTPDFQSAIEKYKVSNNVYLALPAINMIGALLKGQSTANVVRSLYPSDLVKPASPNFYAVLQSLVLLSESVRDSSGKTYANWVSGVVLQDQVLNNKVTKEIFMGLLYEEFKGVTYQDAKNNPINATTLLDPDKISALIASITTAWNALDADLKNVNNPANKSKQFDLIMATINDVSTPFQTAIDNTLVLFNNNVTVTTEVNQCFNLVPSMTTIVENVHDTQYSAAVFNSIILLNKLLQNDQDATIQNILKYASFMASIAEAKTSTDISNAIDAAILPVGSSSIKANTRFSISINSYIGAGVYYEKYNNGNAPTGKFTLPTAGVSLPIGVAFNWGTGRWGGKYLGAISAFASIIDIGAIASFNLSSPDNVSTQSLPQFTWQNLLAPGAYVVFGRLLNSPLSLGLGIQKGPQLRDFTYTPTGGTTVDLTQNASFRYGLFLSIDIPFFNLHSVAYDPPLSQSKK